MKRKDSGKTPAEPISAEEKVFFGTDNSNAEEAATGAEPDVNLSATFFADLEENKELENGNTSSPERLVEEQINDKVIAQLRKKVVDEQSSEAVAECFYMKDGVLMRKSKPFNLNTGDYDSGHKIVVPQCYRQDILRMAHDLSFAGHMGVRKTHHRILPYFYWPGLRKDVEQYCRACHVCQMVGNPNQQIPVAPLQPIPAFDEPFSRILIDCVGPLPKTKSGFQYCAHRLVFRKPFRYGT
jgi:Integrase zinc binding domain